MSDLEQLMPAPVTIEVAGERIEITPIKVKELSPMMHAVDPVFDDLVNGVSIRDLLERHTDAVIEVVVIGVRQPRAWVEELELDQLAALAEAVIEVNTDFFTRRVRAAMRRMVSRLIPPPGSVPSSDSSAPGTASAT